MNREHSLVVSLRLHNRFELNLLLLAATAIVEDRWLKLKGNVASTHYFNIENQY